MARRKAETASWRDTLRAASSAAGAPAGKAASSSSAGKAASSAGPRIEVPKLRDLSACKVWLPPTGSLAEVGDTKTGRVRIHYGPAGERVSTGSSFGTKSFVQVITELLKWAWEQHLERTGEVCPHAWLK